MKKRKKFVHLKTIDRDRMEALLSSGHKQSEVARILKVDKSTVSRERQKKRIDGYYDALVAEHKAQIKRGNSKYQGMKIEKYPWLRKHIISELKQLQSPDCIAGRMKEERWPIKVSGDAIYRWLRSIYGQRYCKYLCTKRYRRKKQTDSPKRFIIPNMISIHNIPADPGFVAEGDTFLSPKKVSKTSAVLVGWKESKLLKGDIVKSLRPMHTTKVVKRIGTEYVIDAMILDQG